MSASHIARQGTASIPVPLRVYRMPLSCGEEGKLLPSGYHEPAEMIGRRVWGPGIGSAQWMIVADGDDLALCNLRDDGRVIQRWTKDREYDSPWGGGGLACLIQCAEMHEAHEFNAYLAELESKLAHDAELSR